MTGISILTPPIVYVNDGRTPDFVDFDSVLDMVDTNLLLNVLNALSSLVVFIKSILDTDPKYIF